MRGIKESTHTFLGCIGARLVMFSGALLYEEVGQASFVFTLMREGFPHFVFLLGVKRDVKQTSY